MASQLLTLSMQTEETVLVLITACRSYFGDSLGTLLSHSTFRLMDASTLLPNLRSPTVLSVSGRKTLTGRRSQLRKRVCPS